MASLEFRSNAYRIVFRFRGKKFQCPLKTEDRKEAEGCQARLDENLRLLQRGRLVLPPEADLPTFLLSDGRVSEKPKLPDAPLTLEELAKQYAELHSNGALESNSLETVKIHLRHFSRTFGKDFPVGRLKQAELQRHVTKRAKEDGIRKQKLSPVTLRKEISSFRAVWNWGVRAGLLTGSFPDKGLVYPKTEEKPPFQTWEEIERQLARCKMTSAQERELWDCLFLTVPQIQELLTFVQKQPLPAYVYPMFCFAAFTGSRRSEMLRSRLSDIDFEGKKILIREKKRTRGHRTSRHAPLSPCLATALQNWLANHPRALETFCQAAGGPKQEALPFAPNQANDIFRQAVQGSKWAKLRGWHVFRHSFASNCAAKGIDQRLIDAWMGHQTEEMRKRYRHLIPNLEQAAILTVFSVPSAG
ncbi:MAG: tyrosine-type recombinase/integrase [Planctomycetes bacterium]|nr:tyrosine-type recombinase/integrase [Planctomycetota bacterium]